MNTENTEGKVQVPAYLKRPYRWVIILIYGIANLAPIVCTYSFMGMGSVIMETYSIDTQLFAMLSTIGFLTGFLFCLPFGGLTDRFGARKVMSVAYLIVVLAMGARLVLPAGPAMLIVTQFFVGFSFCAVNSTVIKSIKAWFDDKEYQVMIGVYIGVATLGAAVGMSSGGIFGTDLALLLKFQFGVMLVVFLLCLFGIRDKPEGAPDLPADSLMKYIGTTLRYKEAWIVAVCYMFLYGGVTSCTTFLVVSLQSQGIDITTASLAAVVVNLVALVGEIVVPALVLKGRKHNWGRLSLIIMAFVIVVFILVGWLSGNMAFFIVVVNVAFFAIGGCLAQTKALPGQIPRLPKECLGTAGGFQATLQNLGAFLIPTFFVAAIGGSDYTVIWILIAVVFVAYGVCCVLIPKDVGLISPNQGGDER